MSDPGRVRAGRFHLSFNAKSGDMQERCVDDLVRFVKEQGEPWFTDFGTLAALHDRDDSPISADSRGFLHEARTGDADQRNIARSMKLLGIKDPA